MIRDATRALRLSAASWEFADKAFGCARWLPRVP